VRYSLLIILFSSQVFAGAGLIVPEVECPTKKLYNKIDFYTQEFVRTIKGVGNVDRPNDATFSLYYSPNNSKARISAFYVSKQGHFLSVLHGFDSCLVKTGHFKQLDDDTIIRTSKPYPVQCTYYERNGKEINVTVYETGKCLSEFIGGNCDDNEDFVLGEVEDTKSSCVKLRTTKGPQNGEQVLVTGFPIETKNRVMNSKEYRKNFSVGNVLDSKVPFCILTKKDKDNEWIIKRVPAHTHSSLKRITADLIHGNSGGPVTDINGEVIGMASSIMTLGEQRLDEHKNNPSVSTQYAAASGWECRGNSYMISITDLMDRLAMRMSAKELEKFLDCEGSE